MNAAARTPIERRQEEWGTSRGLQIEGLADILALRGRILGSRVLKDEDVVWLNQLFLDTRRSNENVIIFADGGLHEQVSEGSSSSLFDSP